MNIYGHQLNKMGSVATSRDKTITTATIRTTTVASRVSDKHLLTTPKHSINSYKNKNYNNSNSRVCFINIQSSLHENVIFSVCACMGNAAYITFIMLNSISGSDAWYHFRFNISCGVAVTVRVHKKKQVIIKGRGGGKKKF